MMFRKGDPSSKGARSITASTRANGGWFIEGGFPDSPLDEDILSFQELLVYEESLKRNGFFGPNSWYMNHESETLLTAIQKCRCWMVTKIPWDGTCGEAASSGERRRR